MVRFVDASSLYRCGMIPGEFMGLNGFMSFSGPKKGGAIWLVFFGSVLQSLQCRGDTATEKAPRELTNRYGASQIVGQCYVRYRIMPLSILHIHFKSEEATPTLTPYRHRNRYLQSPIINHLQTTSSLAPNFRDSGAKVGYCRIFED